MAKGKVKPKPDHVGSIKETVQRLLDERIEFSVGYPADNTAVISIEGNLNQAQLSTIVLLGGLLTDRKFRILVTEA